MSFKASIIVLAYNDAPSLPALVERLLETAYGWAAELEVLIVDDGSRDDTHAVAESLAHQHPEVRYVRHEQNRGVGAAFRSGYEATSHDLIGYVDGDGQYDPGDFALLAAALRDGTVEVASGWRIRRADPPFRKVASACYGLVLRIVFGLRMRDVNGGIKLYTRRFLRQAAPFISDGPFYDAEILITGQQAGLPIAEVPVKHLPRLHGRAGGLSCHTVRSILGSLSDRRFHPLRRKSLSARFAVRVAASLAT